MTKKKEKYTWCQFSIRMTLTIYFEKPSWKIQFTGEKKVRLNVLYRHVTCHFRWMLNVWADFFCLLAFTFCCTFCDGINVSFCVGEYFFFESQIGLISYGIRRVRGNREIRKNIYVYMLRIRETFSHVKQYFALKTSYYRFYSTTHFTEVNMENCFSCHKRKKIHFCLLLPFKVVTNWHFNNFTIHYYSFIFTSERMRAFVCEYIMI